MTVHYPNVKGKFRYVCSTGKADFEVPLCQNLSGPALDDLVADKILQALEPAVLESSPLAAEDLEKERQRLDQIWQQRLQRSRYEMDRARRQYQVVEPENRLVARELEQQWEKALEALQDLEQQYARFRPIGSYEQSANYERLLRRLEELGNEGLTGAEIAEQLDREGFRPAQRTGKINKHTVSRLFQRLRRERPKFQRAPRQARLREKEWFTTDLAAKLQMSKSTLAKWISRGWVHVTEQLPGYRGKPICWADADELERLQRLRQTKHGWWAPPPEELITPKAQSTN